MEQLKTNIENLISGEYENVYRFASQVLAGIESESKTPESKTAHLMLNAIIRFADSRLDIDRTLSQMATTIKSEQSRLRQGSALELGWINPTQFEAAVQESKKLWHEVHTLAYIIGLTGDEIKDLARKIHNLTEYNK